MNKKNYLKGSILYLVATLTIVFLSMTALTIDLGQIFVIKNQLQNAADAAALKGAGSLYPAVSSGAPNWSAAQSAALAAVPLNKVDNIALSTADVTPGYWDLTATSALKAITITPGTLDVPAIQVTISKSAGKNGGPVSLFFGPMIGISTVNLSATAIAITGGPSSVNANSIFPVAMAKSTYDQYWDSANNKPKNDPLTGLPYTFLISEGNQGGWSTFNLQANDTTTIISLIENGNPIALKIGDPIWMTSGAKTAVYSSIVPNQDVVVAIVDSSTPGSQGHVVGFGAIHIDFAIGASQKFIQLKMTDNLKFSEGNPGGPSYGVYMPSTLVK